MADRRVDQAVVTVGGNRLSAELYAVLRLVRVEGSVHLPDAFMLRFDDPHFELFDAMTFRIGTTVEIAFAAAGGEAVTVTKAEVTALQVEQGLTGRHELVVTGMDVAHRLGRGVKTRSFQQMTDADIVQQVAGDYSFEVDVDPTDEVHDYVLQCSQTDHAFLKERARRIGFDLWVADGTLHFKERPSAEGSPPELAWGDNLHKFKVRFSSTERCDEVTVRAWDPSAKAAIVGRASEGDLGTDAPAAGEIDDDAKSAFGETKRFAGQFPLATQAEADALASSLLLKSSGDQVTTKGEAAGDPAIAAGADVRISAVGEKLSGTYRITSVEHVYGAGTPYVTRFVCGGKDSNGLADLFGASTGAGLEHRGWGSLVIGVVTNNDDDHHQGRVKVKFPSLTDDDESTWAKVALPGAGASRGLELLPEINDEVLVGFEHDDTTRPVVIGGLWNGKDAPPKDVIDGGKVKTRTWVSRNGHAVEMSDEDGAGSVTLSLGDAKSVLLVKQDETKLTGEKKLTISGQTIEIKADQKLVLKASQIEINADTELKLSGTPIKLN